MAAGRASSQTKELVGELRLLVEPGRVLDSPEARLLYSYDATTHQSWPDVVVKAQSAADVAAVLKLAAQTKVPVVPRGAGTGLSGGAVPAEGGIALVLAGMAKIKEIDRENMVAVCEPGVITAALQKAVERRGLFYPPDPSSLNYCTIGGNVAENAGGPRGLKYGVTKDYVLGLEVVFPGGETARFGGRQVKNVTGYNFTQLFVGSEGTLGVVTEVTLRLLPLPPARKTMAAAFARLEQAADAVTEVLAGGVVPSVLELMDQKSINYVEDYLGIGLPRQAEAMLIIEVDGLPAGVEAEAEVIGRVLRSAGVQDLAVAEDDAEAERLWKARRAVSPALSRVRPTKIGEDVCVPRSAIPALVREIRKIEERFRLPIAIFGHAGDGNLHPNILTDRRDPQEMARAKEAVRAIFEAAVKLGGTLSGEHGVGLAKKPYLGLDLSPQAIHFMRAVKSALDPDGILNPGKIFGSDPP
jgi:glycolate oxidase